MLCDDQIGGIRGGRGGVKGGQEGGGVHVCIKLFHFMGGYMYA